MVDKSLDNILKKSPNLIPLIVRKDKNSKNIKDLDKNKILMLDTLTIGHLSNFIIKKISINSSDNIFIFVENMLANNNDNILDLYNKYKNLDNFLYLYYSNIETFE
jgi:hypothetical protein